MFLPKDYQSPKGEAQYMKLEEGENKFRILSPPILGWEDWVEKKPIRWKFENKPKESHDPKKPVKHFWSMIVWNYVEEEIQILHLTQASIRSAIEAFSKDEDWGAPYFYDLKIIKKGQKMESEYKVMSLPHKPLPDFVREKFNQRPINLDALYDGKDPFARDQDSYTAGIFSQDDLKMLVPKRSISEVEEYELLGILEECQTGYKDWVMKHVKKTHGADSLAFLPRDAYEKLKAGAYKNRDENYSENMAKEMK